MFILKIKSVKYLLVLFFVFFTSCFKKETLKKDFSIQENQLFVVIPDSASVNEFPIPDSVPVPENNKIRLSLPKVIHLSGEGDYGGFSNIKSYSQENGLVLDAVSHIFCDSRGYLWIGTIGGGVSRFDGNTFLNYSTNNGLPNNVINDMVEDEKGRIWFATDGGLSVYDGISFKNYSVLNSLRRNEVIRFCKDKYNKIWAANKEGGIFYIQYDSIHYLFKNNEFPMYHVRTVLLDSKSRLWIGTIGAGLFLYHQGNIEDKNDYFKFKNEDIRALFEDKSGNIWIGTWGEGVIRFNTNQI